MTIATIHLHLTPYPAQTPRKVIDFACAVASLFEATLEVSSVHLSVRPVGNLLTVGLVQGMADQLEIAASEITAGLEAYLEERGLASNIQVHVSQLEETWPGAPNDAWRGRTSDLCILPLTQGSDDPHFPISDWLFQSGRPCLLHPTTAQRPFSLNRVLVCWDYSRAAARAINDALPFLHNAASVQIAVFRGEKDIPVKNAAAPILAFLQAHGIRAEAAEVEIAGRPIGKAICDHAAAIEADLVVMGAFGHALPQEFLFGGATRDVLAQTRLPVLMSH